MRCVAGLETTFCIDDAFYVENTFYIERVVVVARVAGRASLFSNVLKSPRCSQIFLVSILRGLTLQSR